MADKKTRIVKIPNMGELFRNHEDNAYTPSQEDIDWDRMKPVGHEIGSVGNPWGLDDDNIDDNGNNNIRKGSDMTDSNLNVLVRKIDGNAVIPQRKYWDDAGADLSSIEELTLAPGERRMVHTGLAIAFPAGYVCEVVPRSGLAAKHGITIVNAPGIVDSGYRGELMVILLNTGDEPFEIKKGDRIAQMLFKKVELADFTAVDELPVSERGEGGFGSTGVK